MVLLINEKIKMPHTNVSTYKIAMAIYFKPYQSKYLHHLTFPKKVSHMSIEKNKEFLLTDCMKYNPDATISKCLMQSP